MVYLTQKQKDFYHFIKSYIKENDLSPSFEEIKKHFGFKSLSTVHDYIQTLKNKNYIKTGENNMKRSIELMEYTKSTITIPILGTVAAGGPIDVYEIRDSIEIPESLASGGENVALIVKGNSMIESGIYENDTIIVKRQQTANNGDIVVALVNNQVTIKTIYFREGFIELKPSNSQMQSLQISADEEFEIYGLLVGLYRKF